jgi:prevent-host-death family protein
MSTEIGVRELRNDVSEVLRRAESGEDFVVTVRGRQVARLTAIEDRPRTMPAEIFIAGIAKVGADPELLEELCELAGGSIDEIDPWSGS